MSTKDPPAPVTLCEHAEWLEKKVLGGRYKFRNTKILRSCLLHSAAPAHLRLSWDAEWDSYEVLEWLGDAILDLLVVEVLYGLGAHFGTKSHDPLSPGDMSTLKAMASDFFSLCRPILGLRIDITCPKR